MVRGRVQNHPPSRSDCRERRKRTGRRRSRGRGPGMFCLLRRIRGERKQWKRWGDDEMKGYDDLLLSCKYGRLAPVSRDWDVKRIVRILGMVWRFTSRILTSTHSLSLSFLSSSLSLFSFSLTHTQRQRDSLSLSSLHWASAAHRVSRNRTTTGYFR